MPTNWDLNNKRTCRRFQKKAGLHPYKLPNMFTQKAKVLKSPSVFAGVSP